MAAVFFVMNGAYFLAGANVTFDPATVKANIQTYGSADPPIGEIHAVSGDTTVRNTTTGNGMGLENRHYRELSVDGDTGGVRYPAPVVDRTADTIEPAAATPAPPPADIRVPDVTEEVAAVTGLEQRRLRREAAVIARHLDAAVALHGEMMAEIENAIAAEPAHFDGLDGCYDGEAAARDRVHELRREQWQERRRYHRERQALEQDLVAAVNELEAERRIEDVARDILGE